MKVLRQNQLQEIISELNHSNVVAVPTETVFGLAVKFDDVAAIDKLAEIKQRDYNSGKVFTLMLADVRQIERYALLNDAAKQVVSKYLPGELTVVLMKNPEFTNPYFDDHQTIGIRIPNHQFMLELLGKTGPLIVTSANEKGLIPALDSDSIKRELPEVDIVVEGSAGNQPPSTVVDFTTVEPKILRQGNITLNQANTTQQNTLFQGRTLENGEMW
jgi:L-threonylcarbamoyladenylate synthase